ncbi:MAG: hypothetical protein CMB41_03820 [Euryarchaeota archaeon]|nr:hypothetical protein [Euryarchaeota archaeon]
MRRRRAVLAESLPLFGLALVILGPMIVAVDRLWAVTGTSPIAAALDLSPTGQQALWTATALATLAAVGTIVLGVPVAFALAATPDPWRRRFRALIALPFVCPSIVAAVGFLALMDLLGEGGQRLRGMSVWPEAGPGTVVLLVAMVWFNLSLAVRVVEPSLARADPRYLEQLRLLPQGQTLAGRIQAWWAQLLGPGLMAAAGLTFTFAFTSFALVRWLAPDTLTLEVLLAEQGSGAGIPGYRVDLSRLVLGAAVAQAAVLLIAVSVINAMQRRHAFALDAAPSEAVRSGLASGLWGEAWLRWTVCASAAAFAVLPLVLIGVGSVRMRTPEGWTMSLDGWRRALAGDAGGVTLMEAFWSTFHTAALTVALAVPAGWYLATQVHRAEREGRARLARIIDLLAMVPLVVSGAMVGLGSLLGLLRFAPGMLASPWLLPVAHATLVLPIVVRVLLPAMRQMSPDFEACAATLGLGPGRRFALVRWPMLRPATVVAAGLALAFSLGEFGASWIVVRSTDASTLAVLVDTWLARPGFDPTTRPAAMAVAVVLGTVTMVLMVFLERWREDRVHGGL